MIQTNSEIVATYLALLIFEYNDPNNTPNAIATINLLATEAIANQVVGQVGAGFSINGVYNQTIAVGTQLNIMAQFVGAERVLPNYAPGLTFYGFEDTTGPYVPTIGGMGDTTVGIPVDYWESTNQTVGSYTLSDGEMINLILFLAAVNNAYLSVENVDNILFEFFGNLVTMTETSPMEITYTDSPSDTGTLFGIINYLNAFPHPAGVEVVS